MEQRGIEKRRHGEVEGAPLRTSGKANLKGGRGLVRMRQGRQGVNGG